MSEFTESEIAYLTGQRLGRLATVGEGKRPHVVPVGYRYDAETEAIDIGGREFGETKKFRDASRNPNVAFVVDDLASVDPWRARGVEIRGHAETFREGGDRFGPGYGAAWMRITPTRVVSWGLDDPAGSRTE